MPEIFDYSRGESAVLVSFPHDGTEFPSHIKTKFNRHGRKNTDCDWYIYALYEGLLGKEISYIRAKYSRYVVDLNRSPEGELLYPGKLETGICPLTTFDGVPIYLREQEPDAQEIHSRVKAYWQAYHDHLQAELNRIRQRHGYVILWDAHSIRAEVPSLFNGILPDLNFGTADGHSCASEIITPIVQHATQGTAHSVVLNERFKGGYITRHYGNPEQGVHAIQLEINQANYLDNSVEPKIHPAKTRQLSCMLANLMTLL